MPVKSHSNTKKKKSLTNTQKKKSGSNKSGTAKRSKNMSRKGGAKTKGTAAKKKTTAKKSPSPSPESSGDDEDNYFHQIITEGYQNHELGTLIAILHDQSFVPSLQ